MIYKVWVKDGVPASAETLNTSRDGGEPCSTWKEYISYMSDILTVHAVPIPHATAPETPCHGRWYYVESGTLAAAVSKVDRVLLADRLRG